MLIYRTWPVEPGPHSWKASALNTALPLLATQVSRVNPVYIASPEFEEHSTYLVLGYIDNIFKNCPSHAFKAARGGQRTRVTEELGQVGR